MIKKLLLALLLVGIPPFVAFATQTETITLSTVEDTEYRSTDAVTVVHTATAANENDCVDARGYNIVCYFANVGGTINVDIDRFYTDDTVYDGTVVSEWNADIVDTTDETGCEVVSAPFYCFDVDSSTSGTLSLTWYLVRTVVK